jgi:hypothetical protein
MVTKVVLSALAMAVIQGPIIGYGYNSCDPLLSVPKPDSTWPKSELRWAIVVGVGKYDHLDRDPNNEIVPCSHAQRKLLIRYGFPTEQIIHLASDQPEERHPTRANILRRISNLLTTMPRGALLVFIFNGEVVDVNGEPHLLVADTQTEDITNPLDMELSTISKNRIVKRIVQSGYHVVIKSP